MENKTTSPTLEVQPSPEMQSSAATIPPAQKHWYALPARIIIYSVILSGAFIYTASGGLNQPKSDAEYKKMVAPANGVVLPVTWGNLGAQIVSAGVIDKVKFEKLYENRDGMTQEMKDMLYGDHNGKIKITAENSGFILNLLWALGLGNKNEILDNGPMQDPKYGGTGGFASTGGWDLSVGKAMDHYSKHSFIILTADQQKLVEDVSKNIYRPCCNNSTYFPDCNHGMAMLALLELMASQGVSEGEMYKAALAVNSYWFPDTYATIAKFLNSKGVSWKESDPKTLIGYDFSSASGFMKIQQQIAPVSQDHSVGCGA